MSDKVKSYWAKRHDVDVRTENLFAGYWSSRYKDIIDAYVSGVGGIILDIGCGNAKYFRLLEGRFDEYYGTELTDSPLEIARKVYPRGKYFVNDGTSLPFDASSVDVIISIGALEHNSNIRDIVSECRRVLKPGGTFLFSIPNYMSVYFPFCYLKACIIGGNDRIAAIGYYYRVQEIRRIFNEHGFEDVNVIDSVFANPFPVKWLRRLNGIFFPLERIGLGFMRVFLAK